MLPTVLFQWTIQPFSRVPTRDYVDICLSTRIGRHGSTTMPRKSLIGSRFAFLTQNGNKNGNRFVRLDMSPNARCRFHKGSGSSKVFGQSLKVSGKHLGNLFRTSGNIGRSLGRILGSFHGSSGFSLKNFSSKASCKPLSLIACVAQARNQKRSICELIAFYWQVKCGRSIFF